MSVREHGTNAKFVLDRCRCQPCKEAHSDYEKRRRRRKAYGGDYWPWVDAAPVRRHVLSLMTKRGKRARDGLGPKRISRITGMPHGTISKLLYGNYRGRPPSKRVRKDTAAKLLALNPSDAYLLDATPLWRMIDELVDFGVPKSRIAQAIGKGCAMLQLSESLVNRDNLARVSGLHWAVFLASSRFRLGCECLPPAEIRNALELEGDNPPDELAGLHTLTRVWTYASVRAAKQGASRFAPTRAEIVVTDEPDGFHWHPIRSVPTASDVRPVAFKEAGRWREAS